MKYLKSIGLFRPFENLKSRLKIQRFPAAPLTDKPLLDSPVIQTGPEDDQKLFLDAMTGVKPISRKNIVENRGRHTRTTKLNNSDDRDTIIQLNKLIQHGEGFIVSSTPEYMEGTGYHVHPEISKRLHRGDFSIQAHIDLHGMTVAEAEEAFNLFIKKSIMLEKRALLIIHGRGLSSPQKPVLKSKVYEWLTCSPWRKWVIAFSRARPLDGGGATYVLLRKKPVTKRYKKKGKSV